MKFRTILPKPEYPFELSYLDKLFMMGSCFSDNIGEKLTRSKFQVISNPLGIVYNPISISTQLKYMIAPQNLNIEELYYHDDLWHHFDFHGSFSGTDKSEVFESLQFKLIESGKFLKNANYLFITFGTASVYRRKDNGKVVANNHKFPINEFEKERLTVELMLAKLQESFRLLKEFNPTLKIILTLSPVRYVRDGLIENQRSKASLFMMIDALEKSDNVFYFPSYEIFMDDLRDYRFYKEDLVHPSMEGLEYTWEVFKDSFLDLESYEIEKEVIKLIRSIEHRPIHEESSSHKDFRNKLFVNLNAMKKKYPFLNLQDEIEVVGK